MALQMGSREHAEAYGLDLDVLKRSVIQMWKERGNNTPVKVVSATRGYSPSVRGYITTAGWVKGCGPADLEKRLGLPAGELAAGAVVMTLARTPAADEFEMRGYSQCPDGLQYDGGRYPPGAGVPQWQLTKPVPTEPAHQVLGPNDRYK